MGCACQKSIGAGHPVIHEGRASHATRVLKLEFSAEIAANSRIRSKGKGGKGHGIWVKEPAPKLLELFEKAVLNYAEEVLKVPKEAGKGPLEEALKRFSQNHMVCVQRVKEKDAEGSIVLIPGDAHVLAPNCEVPFNIDGFPGATVLLPMGTNQWLPPVGSCFLTACLRACSITTVIIVDVDLWYGGLDEQPILSKAFVIMSVLCMGLELWLAAQNVSKLKKKMWYHPWEHLSSLPLIQSFDAICHAVYALAAEMVLRFLGLPHAFLAAPKESFDAAKRLPGCHMPCPILANISPTARDFELDNGLYNSYTKVIAEDIVMLAMKICLVCSYVKHDQLNGALLLCATIAVLSSFWSFCWVRRYLSALLKYETEMEAHIHGGDPFDMAGRQGNLRAVAGK